MKQLKLLLLILITAITLNLTGCATAYKDTTPLAQKVKVTLLNTNGLNANGIVVETSRDNVELNGFIDSIGQSQLAEATATQVPGVRHVKNNLIVKTGN